MRRTEFLPLGRSRLLLCAFVFADVSAFPRLHDRDCVDVEQGCAAWAAAGECDKNVGFMKLHACRSSCASCHFDHKDMAPEAVRASADDEDETSGIMRPRRHGTCAAEPGELRWGLSAQLASSIACFNRRGAEPSGSYEASADFLEAAAAVAAATPQGEATITFYDAATRRPLFIAPRNRTMDDFLVESKRHGWPSFRDSQLVAENVRVLRGGEVVSIDGTHLGHNLPDRLNRYCINLVSVAGAPPPG